MAAPNIITETGSIFRFAFFVSPTRLNTQSPDQIPIILDSSDSYDGVLAEEDAIRASSCLRNFFEWIEDFQTWPPEMPVVARDNS
jgi:hypothetical protein